MTQGFNFFNVEYFLTRIYDAVFGAGSASGADTGSSLGALWHAVPSWISFLTSTVAIIGMVASLILLILFVYARIRLVVVEHEGFHGKEVHQVVEVEQKQEGPPPQQERWKRIMELASSGHASDWRRAILEADIMLSAVLLEAGYEGATVGEQLKMANPFQLTTLDLAWKAHKVRNEVAHGGEAFNLTERDTRVAIDQYRRVFEELGAI